MKYLAYSQAMHTGAFLQALHPEESGKAVFWESLVRLQSVVYTIYLEALYQGKTDWLQLY